MAPAQGPAIHTSLKASAPFSLGEKVAARARPDEGRLTTEDLRGQGSCR